MKISVILVSLILMSMYIHKEPKIPLVVVKYYVSTTDGNDTNTGTSSTPNPSGGGAGPWKTISKVNTQWSAGTFNAGDSILFKSDDTWKGTTDLACLTAKEGGTSSALSINISSYGTGAKPKFDGFITLSSWVADGGNVYHTFNANLGNTVTTVLRNGIQMGEGRWPDAGATTDGFGNTIAGGYMKIDTFVSTSIIEDNQLPGSPDWDGADVVCRVNAFVTDRRPISSHSSHRITVSPAFTASSPTIHGWLGYFITNHRNTLTKDGEWFYDAATQTMYFYSSSGSPTGIEVTAKVAGSPTSNTGDLINVSTFNYIHINNLYLRGANDTAIKVGSETSYLGGNGFSMVNTRVDYAKWAVKLKVANDSYFYMDTILHTGGRGIYVYNSSAHIVRKCYVDSTCMFPEQNIGGDGGGVAIHTRLSGYIDSNTVLHTGYSGIRFNGDNVFVRDNVVIDYCLTINDGGGIYYVRGTDAVRTSWQVTGNLCMNNGRGAVAGSSNTWLQTAGIYLDNDAQAGIIDHNVCTGNQWGIYLHRGRDHTVRDNLCYGNTYYQVYMNGNKDATSTELIRNIVFKHNILISTRTSQYCLYITDNSTTGSGLIFNSVDSNKYWRPRDTSNIIWDDGTAKSLSVWQSSYSTYDDHSTSSPPYKYTSDVTQDTSMIFVYNDTWAAASESLLNKYSGYTNMTSAVAYTTGIILKDPVEGYVLFRTGELDVPPTPPPSSPKLGSRRMKTTP